MKHIPNIISAARIVLIPFFCIAFLNDNLIAALIILALSGISDLFDGYLARKLNAITVLGKWLDPIGDKATLAAVIVCLWIRLHESNAFITPLMFIMIGKELILAVGGFVLKGIKKDIVPSQIWGKVATVVFFVTMCVATLLMTVIEESAILNSTVTAILILNAVIMIYALIKYILLAIKLLKDKSGEELEQYNKNQNKNILEMIRNNPEE